MKEKTLRCAVVLALAVVGGALLLDGLALGKPPSPPPPPPPGSICFWYESTPFECWAMNGNGDGKQPVMPPDFFAIPSNADHGGHTWWLCVREDPDGGNYPDTTTAVREVYLVRADSQNVIESVKLTDLGPVVLEDGTVVDPGITPVCETQARASWSNDGQDTFVSFVGYDRADHKYYIHRAAISFPSDGPPQLMETPQVIMEVPHRGTPFHWSPNGQMLTYEGTSEANGRTTSVRVYDTITGQSTEIYDILLVATGQVCPRWSPPGVPERIAFRDSGPRLCTIAPDGTDLKVIYGKKPSTFDQMWYPCWSPNGQYIACTNVQGKMSGVYWYDIAIVPAQGGAKTILTADMPDLAIPPLGWRSGTPVP